MRLHGWDLSLNHSGFVELDGDGKLSWWTFVSKTAKDTTRGGRHLKLPKCEDGDQLDVWRLQWWEGTINSIMTIRNPDAVAIEHYAFSAQSQSTYQIGELGGQARLSVMRFGAMLRLHEPKSVKMFSAHNGAATPEEQAEMAADRWPELEAFADLPKIPRLDLIVAYTLAKLLHLELELRAGRKKLDDLHAKEVQVFNRCTKSQPLNLLGREFIQWLK